MDMCGASHSTRLRRLGSPPLRQLRGDGNRSRMSNPAQVIVLAEDTRQTRLVKAWVRRRRPDLSPSVIRVRPMAQGRGGGAQRVLDNYEPEVRAHLMRHASKWLIVVIDADNETVA